jgi:hypothetical protein
MPELAVRQAREMLASWAAGHRAVDGRGDEVVRTAAEAGLIMSGIGRLAGIARRTLAASPAPGEAACRDRRACAGVPEGISGASQPPRIRQKCLVTAEDRGFEPRRAARPNRISSAFPLVTGRSGHDRDRPEWQASRAGNAGIVPGLPADARRVRTHNGHTHGPDAGHRGSASMAGRAPAMRSIVVRAMPASR